MGPKCSAGLRGGWRRVTKKLFYHLKVTCLFNNISKNNDLFVLVLETAIMQLIHYYIYINLILI